MLSRVFNFVKTIFSNRIEPNLDNDLQQHVIISRKRSSDAANNDGLPSKRRCLDGGILSYPFLSGTEDQESRPLQSLIQDSAFFIKPEMRKSASVTRKNNTNPSCRASDFLDLKGPGDGFSSLRSTNPGKENNIIEISDNEDDETHVVQVGKHMPTEGDGEPCWVNAVPKYSSSSKSFQRSCYKVNDQSVKNDSLPPNKHSGFLCESMHWRTLGSSSSKLPNRGCRTKLTLRPKRLDSKEYTPLALTASAIRGIKETIRLEEKNSYSKLLQHYEAEKSRHHVNTCSMTQPTKFSGVFSNQTPSVSFVKYKGKIELIDLTKKMREQGPKVRRDQEVKPQTVASKMASGSTQIAVPLAKTTMPTINSFADVIKFNKYYQTDFLADTLHKFEQKKRESEKDLQEPLYRAEQYARNNEKNMKQIEERMMRHIKITDSDIILEEAEEEDVELPTLTPRIEKAIDAALLPYPSRETLVEAFSLKITRHDMHTLANLNWLNDEVINFYMNLLIERGKLDTHPKVYAFNTFFYSKLVSSGYMTLKRWTRKIDIFSYDIIVVPVHLGMHWCMAAIDFRNKTIKYYDSMGNPNKRCLQALAKYLEEESLDKKKVPYDTSKWKLINVSDNPQQMNGSDCGVFACMYAEFISRDASITFTQDNMPFFRRKMVYEILSAKLFK